MQAHPEHREGQLEHVRLGACEECLVAKPRADPLEARQLAGAAHLRAETGEVHRAREAAQVVEDVGDDGEYRHAREGHRPARLDLDEGEAAEELSAQQRQRGGPARPLELTCVGRRQQHPVVERGGPPPRSRLAKADERRRLDDEDEERGRPVRDEVDALQQVDAEMEADHRHAEGDAGGRPHQRQRRGELEREAADGEQRAQRWPRDHEAHEAVDKGVAGARAQRAEEVALQRRRRPPRAPLQHRRAELEQRGAHVERDDVALEEARHPRVARRRDRQEEQRRGSEETRVLAERRLLPELALVDEERDEEQCEERRVGQLRADGEAGSERRAEQVELIGAQTRDR